MREMNAVDSEFRKNLSSEDRRSIQIEKTVLARKQSALNAFSTGNLKTLNVPNIRELLLGFHRDHYSSNLMSLCLVGNHSLNVLQDLAISNFSQVEDKQLRVADYSQDVMYDDTALGHVIRIVPIKEIRRLELKWPMMPDSRSLWDGDPLAYISHLVGHEGRHSLLSELIKSDLASSISAGGYKRLQNQHSGFSIRIGLTQKGDENLDKVIRLVFGFINRLKSEPARAYVFDEVFAMKTINFDNKTRKSAMSTA